MPAFEFSVPHTLAPAEVVTRIKGFLATLREQNSSRFLIKKEEWQENKLNCSFSSYGFAMDAVINVLPAELKIQLSIPIAAMLFKGQIEDQLRSELTKMLK